MLLLKYGWKIWFWRLFREVSTTLLYGIFIIVLVASISLHVVLRTTRYTHGDLESGRKWKPCFATSEVPVGKCCREVRSSSGSIPVPYYQPPVSVRAPASILGQCRSSRHRMDPIVAAVAASWFWIVLWRQHGLQRRVLWWLSILGLSPCDGGSSFFGTLFYGAALGSFLEAWPKACSSNLQQFCKRPLLYVKSLLLKITRVVSGFLSLNSDWQGD